ncbi:hypothetical protein [Epilithonimonas tenax]|uniref:hypothetical protein n=1 Tax=Epilithonimonas tenax TaxID=191577 RepID=UPI000404B8D9|nr:hypothetical protein [Epilithonimonas tenax]
MKNIYIPNPCSENWNEMSPEAKGRFCSVCSKCVIDFTEKNAVEIQQIITEKSDESVCGRFYNHQLNNDNSKAFKLKEMFFKFIPSGFHNHRLSLGIFSLILFLTGCNKEKESCVATTGVVLVEEDILKQNNDYEIGEVLIENDSVAKMPKKDSIALKKKPK